MALVHNGNQNINNITLSVIATSRNDDHGGDLISRMQHFVDGFLEQCENYRLSAELILVEWNPPGDKPKLVEKLNFPTDRQFSLVRIITVPEELHKIFENSDKISLFQMIAKNVGIRRAKGKFILATNIDILFSNDFFDFFKTKLEAGILYRSDRVDVNPHPPLNVDINKKLIFCSKNMVRINSKSGTFFKINGKWKKHKKSKFFSPIKIQNLSYFISRLIRPRKIDLSTLRAKLNTRIKSFIHYPFSSTIDWFYKLNHRLKKSLVLIFANLTNFKLRLRKKTKALKKLHTNGCGDFTLLSKDDWFRLRGYPEWEIFSWHIDSVLLYQAHLSNIREKTLKKIPHYHLDHSIGSGYTHENSEALFSRLERSSIPYITWGQFNKIVIDMKKMRQEQGSIIYNDDNWGLSNHNLEEVLL